jgi:four helix bundle protein
MKIARQFPADEKNMLYNQITRSARSITANIAESHGKFHAKESLQQNRIARGSLKETLDHLFVALDEKYINHEIFGKMKEKYHLCLKLLNGYNKYIRERGNPD